MPTRLGRAPATTFAWTLLHIVSNAVLTSFFATHRGCSHSGAFRIISASHATLAKVYFPRRKPCIDRWRDWACSLMTASEQVSYHLKPDATKQSGQLYDNFVVALLGDDHGSERRPIPDDVFFMSAEGLVSGLHGLQRAKIYEVRWCAIPSWSRSLTCCQLLGDVLKDGLDVLKSLVRRHNARHARLSTRLPNTNHAVSSATMCRRCPMRSMRGPVEQETHETALDKW